MENVMVIASFLVLIALGLWGAYSEKRPFTLSMMFYAFVAVFLGLAPMLQYVTGTVIWETVPYTPADYAGLNMVLIACVVVYMVIVRRLWPPEGDDAPSRPDAVVVDSPAPPRTWLLVALSLAGAAVLIFAMRRTPMALLSVHSYVASYIHAGAITQLLLIFIPRSLPVVCILVYRICRGTDRRVEALLLVVAIACNLPTAIPRMHVAAIYLALAIVYLPFMRRRFVVGSLLFVGLLTVFPALDYARHARMNLAISSFCSADFDSYQLMLEAVRTNFVTNGRQLLGALLFFVPRSLWPGKPIGSGYEVAHAGDFSYDNLSMCWFGEGFVNFGYAGMGLFAIALAVINRCADSHFWSGKSRTPAFVAAYLMALSLEFALLRGALMNIWPYLAGVIILCYIVGYRRPRSASA